MAEVLTFFAAKTLKGNISIAFIVADPLFTLALDSIL